MCRTHRPFADGAGLDIVGTANLVAVIAGYCIGLTERFVAYRAFENMCGTKPLAANETLREVFATEGIGTLVTPSRVVRTM
jgi:hypothetical protein